MKRTFNEEGCFTEKNYSSTIKLKFSTLGSIIEFKTNFFPEDLWLFFFHDES